MKKLTLLILACFFAIGCEKNEPEPPDLRVDELKRKEEIESLLVEYPDALTEIIVKQAQIDPTPLIILHVIKDDGNSFEIECDDFGVTVKVTTTADGKSSNENYFYSHLNLRGYNFALNFVNEPYYAILTLFLTQEYNWRE